VTLSGAARDMEVPTCPETELNAGSLDPQSYRCRRVFCKPSETKSGKILVARRIQWRQRKANEPAQCAVRCWRTTAHTARFARCKQALETQSDSVSDISSELRFEHYRVLQNAEGKPLELGRGAMGVTYKASAFQ
jgi:hypothetical protein